MLNLLDISNWKKELGLLPINLYHNTVDNNKFILQNGGTSDFCIDLTHSNDEEFYSSLAWSSNTKNFISIQAENINIFNWEKPKSEKVSLKIVEENFTKFYNYLILNSLRSDLDIVPFVLNIYRKLRNLINEKNNGSDSLNLLFLLFAAYEDQKALNEIDLEKWGVKQLDFEINGFERYVDEFSSGLFGLVRPRVELILRHASGALFQEAHLEALFFNKNLELFTGTLSGEYSAKKILYSSIHYTPSYLARTIVEQALRQIDLRGKRAIRILDPACGTSEFLMESLKQLKSSGYIGKVEILGLDSSKSAINASNFLLTYEKREWGDNLEFKILHVEDSLRIDWGSDNDLILMNPPFVSWEQMTKEFRESVRESLGLTFEKRPNQASAFFLKAIRSLNSNGIIGCVLPSSIFTLDSYIKFRIVLQEAISTKLIGKLGNFIFENALTDVTFFIGSKPSSIIQSPLVLWTSNEKGVASSAIKDLRKFCYSNVPVINERDYSIYNPIQFPTNIDSWKTLSYQENNLFKKIESLVNSGELTTVQDVFIVKQGIRTGNNQVFKISESFYQTSIPDSEKKYFRPAIDNDSISNGVLQIKNYVWYPYDEHGLLISSEEELINKSTIYYYKILLPNKNLLIGRARKGLSNWWILSEHRAWLIKKSSKLVSTEFGKLGSFAYDKNGSFVVERGNGWIPKKSFKENDYYFYLAVFSSPLFENLLSIYSKQLAGGKWWDLGSKYTRNIPIPKLTDTIKESSIYDKLVTIGKEITLGELSDFKCIDNYLKDTFYHMNRL